MERSSAEDARQKAEDAYAQEKAALQAASVAGQRANELKRAKIRALDNDAARIGPLTVGGVDDNFTGYDNLPRTVQRMRALPAPRILLTHSPDVFPKVAGDVALTLAGHTHCGQVKLALIGRVLRCRKSANADGEGGEHRRRVMLGMAVEGFVDMLEAGLHRNPVARHQRELRGTVGEALKRRQAVVGCELTDRVHPGVERQWGDAWAGVADLGNARGDLRPQMRELIRRHLPALQSLSRLSHFG